MCVDGWVQSGDYRRMYELREWMSEVEMIVVWETTCKSEYLKSNRDSTMKAGEKQQKTKSLVSWAAVYRKKRKRRKIEKEKGKMD